MRVIPFAFLLIITSVVAITAQVPTHKVEGNWLGALEAGGAKLRLALKIQKAENGYTGQVRQFGPGR